MFRTPCSETIPIGATVFLRPEDVAQDAEDGFYASVVAITDSVAFVEPLEGDAQRSESIPVALASERLVPPDEPVESRVSTLLRKPVACVIEGEVRTGQVIGTREHEVQVYTAYGLRWLKIADVVGIVTPLFAMLLFDLGLPVSRWTATFTTEACARLTKAVDDAGPACPRMEDVMAAIDNLSLHTPRGMYREWRDIQTGSTRPTSTDHALLYTFYVDGNRPIPEDLRTAVGSSIAPDPARMSTTVVAAASDRPKTKRPRVLSTFLASDTSYDDGEESKTEQPGNFSYVAAVEAAAASTAQPATAQATRTRAPLVVDRLPVTRERTQVLHHMPKASTSGFVTPAQALSTLRSRLNGDPELLNLLRLAGVGTSGNSDDGQRNKYLFRPSSAGQLIHNWTTAEEYQGTSAHSFVLQLAASPAVQWYPFPSISNRLYELAFGRPGLSFMHLGSVDLLERMALQEGNKINMQDHSVNAVVPDARQPKTWAQMQDAANGFVNYSNVFCDPLSRRLASTLAGFISAMQSYGHWPEAHLQALVYWINEQLYAYRTLVEQHVLHGVGNPADALSWFTPSNPSLVPLQSTMVRLEMTALHAASQGSTPPHHAKTPRKTGNPAPNTGSGISAAVTAGLPSSNGHELCMRFASNRGCVSKGKTCTFRGKTRAHFVYSEKLPQVVREHIEKHLDGLSPAYAALN